MDDNINNLFNFYRETGESSSVVFFEKNQFSFVGEKEGNWPQMVFNVDISSDPADSLRQILSETTKNNYPGFAVCNANLFSDRELIKLRDAGIYPVKTWTLMNVSQNDPAEVIYPEYFEMRRLADLSEVQKFALLVNREIMGSMKISETLAEELYKKNNFQFYGLFIADELVSCLLAYSDKITTGFYFIATSPRFRGRGYAAELIRFAMSKSFQKSGKVVLQAVQKAVPLYEKLGFAVCGRLVIFWKR